MQNKRKSFVLHFDSLDVIEELTDEQVGKLLKKMRSYHNGNTYNSNDKIVDIVFIQFKNQFDRDMEKYENVCNRNRENGLKWGRPKQTQQNPKNPSGYSGNPKKPKKADNDNDNNNDNKNNNNTLSKDNAEQSSEIIKKDNRVLEIDLIIETLKELNWWIIDDKVKQQRIFWKHIKNKLDKLQGFNGDYVWFIKYAYVNSDEYRQQYFRSAQKFYYNIAWIISWIKTNIKTKPNTLSI